MILLKLKQLKLSMSQESLDANHNPVVGSTLSPVSYIDTSSKILQSKFCTEM